MSHTKFNIKVRFLGGLSAAQQAVFNSAAARWQQIITADVPRVRIGGEVIDDVVIEASGTPIDGTGGILGQAGPTYLRPGTFIPAKGVMEFDTADLFRMESDGSLNNVIIHEMGHVLGIGTIWELKSLLQGAGTANPMFTGENAMREFALLIGSPTPVPVPVENTGGEGTRDGHWRESVFGNELMTGFLNPGTDPLCGVTIASLEDLGYKVNLDVADSFELPSHLQLVLMGIGAGEHPHRCCMCGHRRRGTEPVVLPESALIP